MTKDEALKMALEALKSCDCGDYSTGHVIYPSFNVDAVNKAIDAIDDVLAQPWEKFCDSNCVWTDHHPDCKLAEQEPVAYINVEQRKLEWAKYMTWDTPTVVNLPKIPLYTTPPQRKPLTDEEIDRIWGSHTFIQATDRRQQAFARAIEAAHGIKGEA